MCFKDQSFPTASAKTSQILIMVWETYIPYPTSFPQKLSTPFITIQPFCFTRYFSSRFENLPSLSLECSSPPIFHIWGPLITWRCFSLNVTPSEKFSQLVLRVKVSPTHTHLPYCSVSTLYIIDFYFLLKIIVIWNDLNMYFIAWLLLTSAGI